jgi:hypothetical protein
MQHSKSRVGMCIWSESNSLEPFLTLYLQPFRNLGQVPNVNTVESFTELVIIYFLWIINIGIPQTRSGATGGTHCPGYLEILVKRHSH